MTLRSREKGGVNPLNISVPASKGEGKQTAYEGFEDGVKSMFNDNKTPLFASLFGLGFNPSTSQTEPRNN